jgi:enterochelin esterase family protein
MGCVSAGAAPDAKVSPEALIELARNRGDSVEFREAVLASLPDADLKKGTASVGVGPDFLCVVEADTAPRLYVDERAAGPMKRITGANLWYALSTLATGTSHEYHFDVNGAKLGGRTDVPAYLPESYQQSGVPQGTLSGNLTHVSKIYDGMSSEYWTYVPSQYDPRTPAALMVWQDGQGHIQRDGGARTLNVIDNLTYQKRIPVMIQVFISPGKVGDKVMRSIEYDTMDDRYARFLRDEVLPEVARKYNIRTDAYSRGITGSSSGGICAFNVAWRQPDQFSRVFSRIGSFTSIQWHPDQIDGGNVFPFMIRKQPKRNIRVWLQDGSADLENEHGSWPLQNIQMANSLKMREYDFHLSFGNGTHNGAHGNAETPTALAWLWRDYDPAKTEQVYTMEAAEKDKPYFRVTIHNR